VAAVDTVEIADRQGTGRTRCCIGKSAKYLHASVVWRKCLIIRGESKKALPAVAGSAFWLSPALLRPGC
jgi:hypothetical protein